MEKFSSYSFNKAHSASYAHMAYQAVYLKVHHPAAYFAAVLNAGGGYYDLPEYVAEAKRNGLRRPGAGRQPQRRRFEVRERLRPGRPTRSRAWASRRSSASSTSGRRAASTCRSRISWPGRSRARPSS